MMDFAHMTSLAQKTLKEKYKIVLGSIGALLLIVLSASVYAAMTNDQTTTKAASSQNISSENEHTYSTVHPTLMSDTSSALILGTVLSHETANIYPRRDGIVEDIYVDIGDTVKKNQVVALLLPKGVEGQSAALIAEKKARQQQAESDLSTAQQVAQETIETARQNIEEKETELLIAKNEQQQIIVKFKESEANIAQKRNQAFTAVQNARQLVEMIILSSNSRTRDYIQEYEITNTLGQLEGNDLSRAALVGVFNGLLSHEQRYLTASTTAQSEMITILLDQAHTTLNQTVGLLQTTPSVPNDKGYTTFSHQELADALSKVITAQDSVYKAKENLEDASNNFQTMIASEPDLYRAYRSGNTDGVTSNKVKMAETQLQSAHTSLALTEANQEQMVESRRSHVEVASAMLQSEYAQSGHREIRSPFTGTVSKRFIDVGQIVMPSMSAFELTDVPTSLAKKAKAEIQFGLPENLIGAVDVGDTVTFFLQADETAEYTAEVTRKSPQVDMKTQTVTVQAKIPDDLSLPHQTSIRIRLTDEKIPVYRVPSSTVKREEDRNLLWLVNAETEQPVQIDVAVLAEDGEFAELTGDLSEESQIILDPPDLFHD